jgi:hypothetical protein
MLDDNQQLFLKIIGVCTVIIGLIMGFSLGRVVESSVTVLHRSTEPVSSFPVMIIDADWKIVCRGDEVWTEFYPRNGTEYIETIALKDPRTCVEVISSLDSMVK